MVTSINKVNVWYECPFLVSYTGLKSLSFSSFIKCSTGETEHSQKVWLKSPTGRTLP